MLEPILAAVLFGAISWQTWRNGSGELAYAMAGILGLGTIFWIAGHGMRREVWYMVPIVVGLTVVGFLRNR